MAQYANNAVFFLVNPKSALSALTERLDSYSKISGYKINVNKFVMLAIDISEKERRELEALFPAKWKNSDIRYLGVKFSMNLQGFVKKS